MLTRGPDLHAAAAGRRDQPHAAQDPGGAARGDAGAVGHDRRPRATRWAPPFMVVATQNPIEQQGTYPLPEAQLDRFLFKHRLDYPVARRGARVVRSPWRWRGDARSDACRRRAGRRRGRSLPALEAIVEAVRRHRRHRGLHRRPGARHARASLAAVWRLAAGGRHARRRQRARSPLSRGATSSFPTTSSGWPCRRCATGLCSRPAPRSKAEGVDSVLAQIIERQAGAALMQPTRRVHCFCSASRWRLPCRGCWPLAAGGRPAPPCRSRRSWRWASMPPWRPDAAR